MSQPDVNSPSRPRAPGEVDALAGQHGDTNKMRLIAENLHARRVAANGFGGFLTDEEGTFLLQQLKIVR